jgi:hypothetical protein
MCHWSDHTSQGQTIDQPPPRSQVACRAFLFIRGHHALPPEQVPNMLAQLLTIHQAQ